VTIKSGDEHSGESFEGLIISSLDMALFEDCQFVSCNFSGAALKKCKFRDCNFARCNLSNVQLQGSRFSGSKFADCKLVGIDWTRADFPNLPVWPQFEFRNCVLNDSSFFGLHLEQLVIEGCKVHEADFREGNFNQSRFVASDFTKSLFSKTNLAHVDFTDAVNYDIDITNNNVSRAKFSRAEAVRLLLGIDIELVD
jgi:uncharacterized protein YjbI with pentapeptide repeats